MAKITLSRMAEAIIWILMAVGVAFMIALPFVVPLLTLHKPHEPDLRYEKYLVAMYISAVGVELLMWQLRGVMHNINRRTPFSDDTVRHLNKIAFICFGMAIAYFGMMIWAFRFFMAFETIIFAFIGLIALIFSRLFRQAMNYREEHDKTV